MDKSGSGEYSHLGKSSKNRNIAMTQDENTMEYPHLHIGTDEVPGLKHIKLGAKGHAKIKFQHDAKNGGLKVTHMKLMKSDGDAEDAIDHGVDEASE